jgi:Ca2+-binding EF-hand superfamily protein
MNDLKNLKKAFILLDKENNGVISYDVKKLSECN